MAAAWGPPGTFLLVPQLLPWDPQICAHLASKELTPGTAGHPQHSFCLICVSATEYVIRWFECGSVGSELQTFADGGVWAIGGPRHWLPARAAAALITAHSVEAVGGFVAWLWLRSTFIHIRGQSQSVRPSSSTHCIHPSCPFPQIP